MKRDSCSTHHGGGGGLERALDLTGRWYTMYDGGPLSRNEGEVYICDRYNPMQVMLDRLVPDTWAS